MRSPQLGSLRRRLPANAALIYGRSVADDLATGKGHILAAHMKATKAGQYRDLLFGEGTTDYDGALAQLIPQGVRRYVCELWYLGSASWQDDVGHAARFVREKIDRALERHGWGNGV